MRFPSKQVAWISLAVGVLAIVAWLSLGSAGRDEDVPDEPSVPLNVILVSIDTLRADRLGCYGYELDTSPNLDGLAGEGVRFDQAISQAPWTTPSHMSLMTSMYPSVHGINQGWDIFLEYRQKGGRYRILPDDVLTLAEILQQHGYVTRALTGGGPVGRDLGFGQGFERYLHSSRRLTPSIMPRLQRWFDDLRETPFFLFFHTYEVHAPYTHLRYARPLLTEAEAEGLEELFAADPNEGEVADYLREHGLYRKEITSALYDGGIRFTDEFMGQLLEGLRQAGLYDNTIIVVISDHGEEFNDHGVETFWNVHCGTLYDELIRVPLILRVPRRFAAGTVVNHQVELIDVAPTILDLLQIPVPDQMQGQSVVKLMEGDVTTAGSWALSEATCLGPEWKSLRTGRYKYLAAFEPKDGERTGVSGEPEWEKLFDLTNDAREQNDVAGVERRVLEKMRGLLRGLFEELDRQGRGAHRTIELSEEMMKTLDALGYTGDGD